MYVYQEMIQAWRAISNPDTAIIMEIPAELWITLGGDRSVTFASGLPCRLFLFEFMSEENDYSDTA